MTATSGPSLILVSARVDSDLHRQLEETATLNDRTLAAEIRRALRQHLCSTRAENTIAA